MAVKIRLRRMGKKKQPHYRVVVADSKAPRDGRFVETLGFYRPMTNPARLVLDLERVDYWIGMGAETSDTVGNLVTRARAGGDDKVALGLPDAEAEKAAKREEMEARRKAERAAEAEAKAAEEAEAKEAEKAAKAAAAAEAAAEVAEAEGSEEAAAEEAPEAEAASDAPAAEAADEAPEASAEEASDEAASDDDGAKEEE